ncbi:MarR family winged helix-turn-helix transcriptional regulator [Streptomyces sp. NPDC090106]|uniref:MarR family winged helix-turn-helix transcriptional regulator n=1 Tax=Streptomyces sp. NPDC090106 TaxID=3365946 RepID=UPI0038073B4B
MTARPPASGAAAAVAGIACAPARNARLAGRPRRHERLMSCAELTPDRASVAILRRIAESEPPRPAGLAVRLSAQAPHVARRTRQPERSGLVAQTAAPDDRRSRLTGAGLCAVARVRAAIGHGFGPALGDRSEEDPSLLAALARRLVDDFVPHTGTWLPPRPPHGPAVPLPVRPSCGPAVPLPVWPLYGLAVGLSVRLPCGPAVPLLAMPPHGPADSLPVWPPDGLADSPPVRPSPHGPADPIPVPPPHGPPDPAPA